jgi:MarR family transcriptional regulator, lower aerobic nicotinate degradation pathway regulator
MTQPRIPAILDDQIGFNLSRVAQLFRSELMHALADYELTPEQWQVMQTLWSTAQGLNQNEVAHLTLKDKHSVSRILGRLERDGWISRRPDPQDARAFIVEPTAQGNALRAEVPARLWAHFTDILGVLEGDEAAQLLALLKKLRRKLGDEC